MYFANPWGLLGLLALPAILAIHLFHQRFPPLLVAGAHLWGIETRISTAGRRPDRLPVTLSLILELLAALLLTLALSEPRIGDIDEVSHVIAVLDDSASMLAHAQGEPAPRDLALAELQRHAEAGGRDTLFTLIRTGVHPSLIGRRGMDWTEARAALDDWQPQGTHHNFDSAWDEASQIAGEQGRFLFFTDQVTQSLDLLPQQMELIALGRPLDNIAISTARWTIDNETATGRLFFRVSNAGRSTASVQITGRTEAATAFEQSIAIPAGSETPLELDVPGGLGQLVVEISSPTDGLATDNRVILVEPSVRLVTLALTFPPESETAEHVQRVTSALPDLQPGPAELADLIIGTATDFPESRSDLWWLGIGPVRTEEAALASAVTVAGPYILDKQHPLLDGVTLDGVIWAGAQPLDIAVAPLATCDRLPLLAQLAGTETRAYLLNIDLPASNLTRTPDWPILLANLVELRRSALPGLQRWNYRAGEVVRFLLPPGDVDDIALLTPTGRERSLVADRLRFVEAGELRETGIYSIRRQQQAIARFAVNFFDPEESSLQSLSSGRRIPAERYEPTRLRVDDPYSWLIVLAVLLVLAAILGNWFLLRPRTAQRGESVR